MNRDPAKLGFSFFRYPALSVLGWYLGDIHFLCTFPCVDSVFSLFPWNFVSILPWFVSSLVFISIRTGTGFSSSW